MAHCVSFMACRLSEVEVAFRFEGLEIWRLARAYTGEIYDDRR